MHSEVVIPKLTKRVFVRSSGDSMTGHRRLRILPEGKYPVEAVPSAV